MGKRKERVTLSDQETKKAVTEFAEFILAKGDETGKDMLSVEQIRQQFQELNGSIYVNI